jgi:ABC-2 type transport system permease protein
MTIAHYAHTLWYLLQSDFKIFKQTIVDKFIDLFIWILTMIWVTSYLLTAFGLDVSYSNFRIASLAASAGLFEVFPSAVNLVADFEGDNITSFYLTLPVPSWLIFVRNIIFYALNTIALGLLVIPISKLALWYRFDLSHFNFGKYVIIFLLTNIFYAAFTLWIASRVTNMQKIGSVWMRFVYPIWFLGGFDYSLKVLRDFSPALAYLSYLNPMIYVMEGTRNAVLGGEGNLNFWLCIAMLIIFSIVCSWHAIMRLKKRLDFI